MDPNVADILAVAIDEFAQHGLAGARVDAIAARTRTSKRMLYYHFESKEGLYAAALAHAYARVRERHPEPDLASQPPIDALRAYVGHTFDVHVGNPDFVRLVMGENLLGGRFIRDAAPVRDRSARGLHELQALIERGQAAGAFRQGLRVLDVYANVVGLCFHFVSNRTTFSSIFEAGLDPAAVVATRREAIIDTICRQVQADQPPVPTVPGRRGNTKKARS